MDVAWVAEPGWRCHPRRHAAVVASSQVATTTVGGRLGDRHMPGGRRPLGPANVGVTEGRGQDVWRIKEDLHVLCE